MVEFPRHFSLGPSKFRLTLSSLGVLSLLVLFGTGVLGAPVLEGDPRASFSGTPKPLRKNNSTFALPQGANSTLQVGITSAIKELNGGEVHVYKIVLAKDQFAHIAVEQQGTNIALALLDPNGKLLGEMDSPNNTLGPEHISLVAETAGEYKLEVRSIESWALPGRYTVTLTEWRAARPEDLRRVAAERFFMEAEHYSDPAPADLEKQKISLAQSRLKAIETYQKTLPDWQSLEDSHGEAMTYYRLGANYKLLGDFDKSVASFEAGLSVAKTHPIEQDWRLLAGILNDEGVLFIRNNVEKALEFLSQAQQLFETHNDRRGLASAYNNIGVAQANSGRMHEALENYKKALPLRDAEHQQSSVTNLLNNIGGIYDSFGDMHLALDYYNKALAAWRESKNRNKIPIGLNNVAVIYERLGEWQKALDDYNDALSLYREAGDRSGEAATLENIGNLYDSLGDSELALRNYNAALDLLRTVVKDKRQEANVLTHIGQVHLSLGKLDDAWTSYSEALNSAAQLTPPEPNRTASILTGIGAVNALQGNPQKALESYQEALKLRRKAEDRRGEAVTLDKIGQAYALADQPQKAIDSLSQALPLWRVVEDRAGLALSLGSIARLELARGNLAEARKLNGEAVGIIESLRTNVSSQQLRISYFATKQNYYELNIDLNMRLYQQGSSPQYLEAALQASERSRARSLIETLSEARAEIAEEGSEVLLRQQHELQQRLQAKSQAQTGLLSTKHNAQEAEAIAKEMSQLITEYDKVRDRVRASNPKYAHLTQPQPLSLSEIQSLVNDNTLLLEYSLGDRRSYVWVVTPNSIDGFELPARDQIEPVARRVTEALTARNRQEKNESFPQRQLRIAKAEKDYSEASAVLSKLVLEPVASLLGRKRLVVVADGALQMVPFAALPVPANSNALLTAIGSAGLAPPSGSAVTQKPMRQPNSASANGTVVEVRSLIAEHEIVTLPSASVLALQRRELANRKPAPLAVAVLADPVFDRQDARVAKSNSNVSQHRKGLAKSGQAGEVLPKQEAPSSPATSASTNKQSQLASALRDVGLDPDGPMPRLALSRQEAIAISRAVPSNQSFSALDFKASRATAMSAELSKYRIIHFATHGVLDLEHPELSGIVLSMIDQKGQPQDGYLRLHDIYNLNLPAELVVLSACQTGIGKQVKGEGLIALTRGFMYAGAKSVVASLWKVDDAATSELMAEFYRQMFANKLKPAAALREAQNKLSQTKRWHSPYYWAGFFLQGEWN